MILLPCTDCTEQNSFGYPYIFHPGYIPTPVELQLKGDALNALQVCCPEDIFICHIVLLPDVECHLHTSLVKNFEQSDVLMVENLSTSTIQQSRNDYSSIDLNIHTQAQAMLLPNSFVDSAKRVTHLS